MESFNLIKAAFDKGKKKASKPANKEGWMDVEGRKEGVEEKEREGIEEREEGRKGGREGGREGGRGREGKGREGKGREGRKNSSQFRNLKLVRGSNISMN